MTLLIHFLVILLIVALVMFLASIALKYLGAPPEIIRAVWVIIVVIFIIVLLINLPSLLNAVHI